MKTKSLFFALALLIAVSSPMWAGSIVTDEFVPGDLDSEVGLTDGDYTLFTEATGNAISSADYMGISSDASYVGQIGYDASNDVIFLNNKHILASHVSGGRAKSVTITWAGSTAGNTTKSQILVYAGTTAFVGNENKTGVSSKASLVATLKWESAGDVVVSIPSGCTHVAIVGASNASYLEYVSFDWEEITYYAVSVSPGLSHGSIALAKTSAEEGESVSMTITPDMGYELRSYSYNSTVVNLPEAEYTVDPKIVSFSMPGTNVVVSATFAVIPDRDLSDFYFYASASDMAADDFTDEITITSGENYTVYFVTDPPYNAKTLSFEVASESNAMIVSHTYNPKSGEGSVVLKGYAVGETTLTITAAQTALFDEAIGEVTIVIEPKQVVLVTEYEGKAFAATTTLSGSDLAAQEVIIANGNVYYDPAGTYDLAAITWNMETRIVDEEELLALTNASGEYLRTMTSTSYQYRDAFYAWVLEDGRLSSANTKGIKYSNSADAFRAVSFYEDGADYAASVYPVSLSAVSTVETYARTVNNGNYATLCLPYAVSPTFLSGVTAFNITGKYLSGSTVTGIELEEVEGVLVAGKPYVIQAKSSTLTTKYGAATVAVAVDDDEDGLVGNLSASPLAVPDGCYGLASNKLRMVNGGTATVGQYKAYLDLSEVSEVGGAPAPGRRVIYAENQEEIGTSLEDFLNNATSINWNEPVYNALGQRVGKGSAGVLIQNGKKFFVQ